MSKLIFLVLLAAGGWFFFEAQNRVTDWRADVGKNQKQVEDCIDESGKIWNRAGIYISFRTAFQQMLEVNERMIIANDRRVDLLSNKPFGLSLSVAEREKLDRAIMSQTDLRKVSENLIDLIKNETDGRTVDKSQATPKQAATPGLVNSIFPAGVDTPEQRRKYLQELAEERQRKVRR